MAAQLDKTITSKHTNCHLISFMAIYTPFHMTFGPAPLLHPLISWTMKIVIANGLPMAEVKSEILMNPLITND
jgi:hypothetical protein